MNLKIYIYFPKNINKICNFLFGGNMHTCCIILEIKFDNYLEISKLQNRSIRLTDRLFECS